MTYIAKTGDGVAGKGQPVVSVPTRKPHKSDDVDTDGYLVVGLIILLVLVVIFFVPWGRK